MWNFEHGLTFKRRTFLVFQIFADQFSDWSADQAEPGDKKCLAAAIR
jgi:hypothetical protein